MRIIGMQLACKVGFALLITCCTLTEAMAGSKEFDEGAAAYKQQNYRLAAQKFEEAIKASPSDSAALLYASYAYQGQGDMVKARSYMEQVIAKFPGSQAAQLARQALGQNNATSAAGASSSGAASSVVRSGSAPSVSGQSDYDSLPEQSKVYFSLNEANHMMVDVLLNGRRLKCCLDTGASNNLFDKIQLQNAGILPPTTPPNASVIGWAQKATPAWTLTANLQVGSIKRKVPIMVQENLGTLPCLIGQSFFGDLQYEVDSKGSAIVFRKPRRATGVGTAKNASSASAANDPYAIPFQLRGTHMFVQVDVDGRKAWLFLDTGADGTTITQADLTSLGLSVPGDAETVYFSGIDGAVQAQKMMIDHLRIGPMLQQNVSATIIAKGSSCLGQNIFGGRRYSIDNENKLLKFFH